MCTQQTRDRIVIDSLRSALTLAMTATRWQTDPIAMRQALRERFNHRITQLEKQLEREQA